MAQMKNIRTEHTYDNSGTPWKHVIGFALSIILAAFSLWAALYSDYSMKILPAVIAVLAFSQAFLQLFHVNNRYPTDE